MKEVVKKTVMLMLAGCLINFVFTLVIHYLYIGFSQKTYDLEQKSIKLNNENEILDYALAYYESFGYIETLAKKEGFTIPRKDQLVYMR